MAEEPKGKMANYLALTTVISPSVRPFKLFKGRLFTRFVLSQTLASDQWA